MPRSIHDPIYRELVAELIAARDRARLTQAIVAKRLGRPQSYVAKVENCERRLDVVELLHIAKALEIDPMPLLRASWKAVRDVERD